MSRIYFHSQGEETEVSGRERYLFSGICDHLMRDALCMDQQSYRRMNNAGLFWLVFVAFTVSRIVAAELLLQMWWYAPK